MKRGLLALLTLSVLLISFASADSVYFTPITGNDIISSANPSTSSGIVNYNYDAGYAGMGFSILFPLAAPLILEYKIVNAIVNNGITGNIIRNSISPKEITVGVQKDVVGSVSSGPAISEANNTNVPPASTGTSPTIGNCGTVVSDAREQCCRMKGFESWNEDTRACGGNISTVISNHFSEASIGSVLKEHEETQITAVTTGTQSMIKIDKTFYTTSIAQADIVADIISKFAIDKENASSLLKIETGDNEDQQGGNENNQLKVEVNLNHITRITVEKDFVLNSTDQTDIINSIVSESQLTADEITSTMQINNLGDVIREEHRIKFGNITCPDACKCMGSVVRCEFENGTRVMTIYAGNSGNVIIQISGENISTNVILYKSGDHVYGVFAGNDTREVKVLPDEVKNNIKAKIKAQLHKENVTLDDNGTYQYSAEKQARLFLIIPVKVPVQAHVDSSTGIVSNVQSPWWSALAKDE